MITEKELLAKKKEIEQTKTAISELKGEEKALLKQLKEDWKCLSLTEAKVLIKQYEADISKLGEEIAAQSADLEATYLNDNEDN